MLYHFKQDRKVVPRTVLLFLLLVPSFNLVKYLLFPQYFPLLIIETQIIRTLVHLFNI